MSKLFCYRPLKVGAIKHTPPPPPPTDRYTQTVSLRPPIKRSKVGGSKVGAKENANLGNSMSALETYPDVKIV